MTTPAPEARGRRAACLPRRRTGHSDMHSSVDQDASEPRAPHWSRPHHSKIPRDAPRMPPARTAVVGTRCHSQTVRTNASPTRRGRAEVYQGPLRGPGERRSPDMGCGAPSVAPTRVAATPETPGARRTRRQIVALVARAAPAPEAHHPPLHAPAGVRQSTKPRYVVLPSGGRPSALRLDAPPRLMSRMRSRCWKIRPNAPASDERITNRLNAERITPPARRRTQGPEY